MKGRTGSLLEVGTGFHPELTGRENIYMNGTILGMTRGEVTKKLDEIIDFAGVERYIDTPVKRYSSGMMVRLGFAVAAHLEPDILIVDEVLAVGDAEFQKKAIGKMKDVSEGHGRTILFVSHNMTAVKSLCAKGILLKDGVNAYQGSSEECIHEYLINNYKGKSKLGNYVKSVCNKPIVNSLKLDLLEIGIKAYGKSYLDPITFDDKISFHSRYIQKDDTNELYLVIVLKDEMGNAVFSSTHGKNYKNKQKGIFDVMTEIPSNFLNFGFFSLDLYLIENGREAVFIERDIIGFNVINTVELGDWMGREPGPIHPAFKWEKIKLNEKNI